MKKILITAPVHQKEDIFKEYLWSLDRLLRPNNVEIKKFFYLHNCENLKNFLNKDEYIILNDNSSFIKTEKTHFWKNENFSAVASMRTMALEKARNENFDYIFSVDSDVLLNPMTLDLLISDNKDIVGNIYWTDFNGKSILMPNCYDKENMYFDPQKGGMERLKIMGVYDIGVVGACTLIGKRVIDNPYINYYPIENISTTRWEDQAFITRARCLIPDITICVDTRKPARHLYRQSEYEDWIKDKQEYYKALEYEP